MMLNGRSLLPLKFQNFLFANDASCFPLYGENLSVLILLSVLFRFHSGSNRFPLDSQNLIYIKPVKCENRTKDSSDTFNRSVSVSRVPELLVEPGYLYGFQGSAVQSQMVIKLYTQDSFIGETV